MVQVERGPSDAHRTALECRNIGDALLVHPEGKVNPQVHAFVGGLAQDPEHTLVVVDLPEDPPADDWESVARLLKRRGRSFRVITGRPCSESAQKVGQLLADRLDRTVLTPDGWVLPAAGGVLFVPEDAGSGWLGFQPSRPSAWTRLVSHKRVTRVSRRFPVPDWDEAVPQRSFATSAGGTAEPLPAGIWIRRSDQPESEQDVHRGRLAARLLSRPDRLTVVLGCPGGPDLSLKDIERFWGCVAPVARPLVRFAPYGPVAVPEGSALGQVLADRFGQEVAVYAGLPTVGEPGTDGPQLLVPGADGTPGPPALLREVVYRPAGTSGAVAPPPVLRGRRSPVDGLPEVSTGVYRYAPDAVLEVTQSGLWLRPPTASADAPAVHRVPADPGRVVIHFDAGTPDSAERMLSLAEEVRRRLDPVLGERCRVLPAPKHMPETDSDAGSSPGPEAGAPGSGAGGPGGRTVSVAGVPGSAGLAGAEALAGRAGAGAASGAAGGATPSAQGLAAGATGPASGETGPTAGVREPTPGPDASRSAPAAGAAQRVPGAAVGTPDPEAGPAGTPDPAAGRSGPASGMPVADGGLPGGAAVLPGAREGAPGVDGGVAGSAAGRAGGHGLVPGGATLLPGAREGIPGVDGAVSATGASVPEAGGGGPAAVPQPFASVPQHAPGGPGAVGQAVANASVPDAVGPGPAPGVSEPVLSGPATPGTRTAPKPPSIPAPLRPRSLRLESAPPSGAAPAEPARGPSAGKAEVPSGVAESPAAGMADAPTAGADTLAPDFVHHPAPPTSPPPTPPPAPAPSPVPPAPATPAPAARAKAQETAVRVQPVPTAEACAALPERGVEQERAWLRRTFQQQYDAAANHVARVLSESPGLRGGSRQSAGDVVTDLVAVRLYLSGGTDRIDHAVRSAAVGPHVPLARCVASGLRRLPSYRGATMLRTTLSEVEWQWYGKRRVVTEWAFCSALTTAHPDLPGDVDVLIWSMTARRTALLDPTVPDRVFYLPGTSFKVLGVRDEERRVLLLRELTGPEIGADGSVDLRRLPLDDIAITRLEQAAVEWRDTKPAVRLPATAVSALCHPPGLILTDRSAARRGADTAPPQKGTTP
jgi:hypothetical protein